MTAPTTFTFGNMAVLLGNGATPTEVFAAPCGFSQKSLQLAADLTDSIIPDCTDPDAASWVGRDVRSRSASISGSGVMTKEAHKTWRDFFLANTSKNIKVQFPGNLAADGGYWSGKAKLGSFEYQADLGDKVQVSVQIESDGEWTWVAAAA